MSSAFDPSLAHLSSDDYLSVYEPAEDSHLFLDALHLQRSCLSSLLARDPGSVCVEVGSGSGLVLSFLSNLQAGRGLYLATDINHRAAAATQATMKHSHVRGDVVCCDLFSPLLHRMRHRVSVLLFNPPYVPTPASELCGDGIERSWAGGERGREVLDRLLEQLDDLLSPAGVFFCVLIQQNDPADVRQLLHSRGFDSDTVAHRKAGREQLQVLKAWRRSAVDALEEELRREAWAAIVGHGCWNLDQLHSSL